MLFIGAWDATAEPFVSVQELPAVPRAARERGNDFRVVREGTRNVRASKLHASFVARRGGCLVDIPRPGRGGAAAGLVDTSEGSRRRRGYRAPSFAEMTTPKTSFPT